MRTATPAMTSCSRRAPHPPAAASPKVTRTQHPTRCARPAAPPSALRWPIRYALPGTPAAAPQLPVGCGQYRPSPPGARSGCSARNSLFDFTGIVDFRDQFGAGMVFRIAHDRHSSTQLANQCAFRYGGFGVIGALGVNVGAQIADDRRHIFFREDHYRIHIVQCRKHFGALLLRRVRPSFTLQRPRGRIGVDCHHHFAAQLLRAPQITDVPHVQQIEYPVGQNDLLSLRAPALCQVSKLLPLHDLIAVSHLGCWKVDFLMASNNSSCDTVAVPRFITTMPPAKFASRAADSASAPAASAAVKVAITVSPAPVTSVTSSEPCTGMLIGFAPLPNATMPSRPRVTTSDCNPMRCNNSFPAESSRASSLPILVSSASSTSGSLGVAAVTPRYSSIR